MNIYEESLEFHKEVKGKFEITSRVSIENEKDLSLAYTPGVAEPCREIHKDPEAAYVYTRKWNIVAVVSDGTAVLGLGDIGPLAALPVMEGKSILFKSFADVDAFPLVLDTKDTDEIVETIVRIAPTLGGVNLEDISAPRCFEIEKRLKEKLDIPVFHDDQHGTAIVVLAALLNSLKIVNKKLEDLKVIVNGDGSAGSAITRLLLSSGIRNLIVCGKDGAIYRGMNYNNESIKELADITNPNNEKGTLGEVINEADLFIGVSVGNVLTKDMVSRMNKDSIIFAMANPIPEIFPEEAKEAGARIVGTGRSDYSNQINNVLAFPGIFRGALDVRAKEINEEMKLAAAYAIANIVSIEELSEEKILPKAFEKGIGAAVAEAVKKAAIETKVAKAYK